MKRLWQIFVLCVFWGFILWLMAPCLDRKPELEPQEKLTYLVPRRCSCLWLKFRKCGCFSGTLNYTLCHPTVREQNWFAACYEKTMGYLMGATDSVTPDAVLWWLGMNSASELGKLWKKLWKVIPRPSVRHFELYCGTCMLGGNLKILRASSLGNVTQHGTVFRWALRSRQRAGRSRPVPRVLSVPALLPRMNQAPVQGFKMVGNQTMGLFTCRRKARVQGSWRQLLLLLLNLSSLAWTSDALSEEVMVWEPRHS
ncbi:uncharacterized protein C20orf173 homolog [Rhinolophus ferrumequinum]|uniref:uncharacterized protein C20orf173 homolog n=1 Tax=Rhinolophus ferrumequinum TaxID=59479 RepID=UPI00140F7316|nr:uncharacterized protein C20orf173 homolog [Rhinolophus ferrumequinum]